MENGINIVISARLSLQDLATIGKFMQDTGIYTAAKPSGAVSEALAMFADSLRINSLVEPISTTEEALVVLGMLRYPLEQVERRLTSAAAKASRASLREEAIALFGTSAADLTELRRKVAASPQTRHRVEELLQNLTTSPVEFAHTEQVKLAKEKAAQDAALAGMVDTSTFQEEE